MLLSGRVPYDNTPKRPIRPLQPRTLVDWYYNNKDASNVLPGLNPLLQQANVNQTCQGNFECIHDYLIRINTFTSETTASKLESVHQSRNELSKNLTEKCFIYILFSNVE